MRLFRRKRPERRLASVVFWATEAEVAAIVIAVGPCVDRKGPRGGRRKPLVSRWEQWNDDPDRMAVLFHSLMGTAAAEAWAHGDVAGDAVLFRFGEEFVERLAALGPRNPPLASRDQIYAGVAWAWLSAATWPEGQTVAAVEQRLSEYAHKALMSRRDGAGLYYWYGPELPLYTLVSGSGQESWEAWRAEKRRR